MELDSKDYGTLFFDLNSGAINWSYQAPTQNAPTIVAPTSDGGVAITSSSGVLRLDASGSVSAVPGMPSGAVQSSWYGKVDAQGSQGASQVRQALDLAPSFWSLPHGNQSGNNSAIQQVMTVESQGDEKQLPDLSQPPVCWPPETIIVPALLHTVPTCGNLNAIELLTEKSPDEIFQDYIQKFVPVTQNTQTNKENNDVMSFTDSTGAHQVNVTGVGQKLTITLEGLISLGQGPFSVLTERFDPVNHVISAVTLKGHPLAGWRYWRVYSIGTNDLVIETGAYDQPAAGSGLAWWVRKNFWGYYFGLGTVSKGWQHYLEFIENDLHASRGSSLNNTLGGIPLKNYPFRTLNLTNSYWDYDKDFTSYILNNVCQSTSCN